MTRCMGSVDEHTIRPRRLEDATMATELVDALSLRVLVEGWYEEARNWAAEVE